MSKMFYGVTILLLSTSLVADQKLKHEMQSIQDFIVQYIPQEDQQEFVPFYQDIMSKLQTSKQNSSGTFSIVEQKKLEGYIAKGLQGLQMRMPQELARVQNQSSFKITCIRFGIYELFLIEKSKKTSSLFARAQSYVRNVTYKVTQWFESVKHTFSHA